MADNVKNSLGNEEMDFAQMLEESLKNLNTDDKVSGVVVGIAPNEVYVDVGRKQSGFIPITELTDDPDAKVEDLVKVGDKLELLIMKTDDQEGTIMLSKKRIDSLKGWDDLADANKENKTLTGKVTKLIKGGLIAVCNGVRVFIPASLTGISKGQNLEDLLKKEISFKVIEVNKAKRRAIASVRELQKEEREKLKEKFWKTAEVGKKYIGKVRSITSYGAFVDIGGLDGMIHISDLSWDRIKHPTEVVNIGDEVEVYIKELDEQKGKVALGYKKTEDNPWEILKKDYKIGDTIEVKIAGMTNFGAFAKIISNIDGLIHVSQISTERVEKPQDVLKVGDVVKAKILDIDYDKKRISLSIKEASDEDEQPTEKKKTSKAKKKKEEVKEETKAEEVATEEKPEEKKPKRTRKKKEETTEE